MNDFDYDIGIVNDPDKPSSALSISFVFIAILYLLLIVGFIGASHINDWPFFKKLMRAIYIGTLWFMALRTLNLTSTCLFDAHKGDKISFIDKVKAFPGRILYLLFGPNNSEYLKHTQRYITTSPYSTSATEFSSRFMGWLFCCWFAYPHHYSED